MALQVSDPSSIRAINIVDKLMKYIDAYIPQTKTQTQTPVTTATPTSTTVRATTVINNKIDNVWNAIKSCTFKFSSAVKSCTIPDNVDQLSVGNNRIITYTDNTRQTIQIVEISASRHSVSYTVIASDPHVKYTSATHEIRLFEVTTSNQTYMEWRTDFSNDATMEVTQDSKYKKIDAFNDLRAYLNPDTAADDDVKTGDNDVGSSLLNVSINRNVDIDINALWCVVSDFGNMKWNNQIDECVFNKDDNTRKLILRNDGGFIMEQIEYIRNNEYTLKYNITSNTALPVANYYAIIKLNKIDNNDNKTNIVYTAKFNAKTAADSLAIKTIQSLLDSVVTQMVNYAKQQ